MRRFLIVVSAIFAVVVLSWVALIGAVYAWGGVATVRVQDSNEGVNLYVPVPMALVEAAVTTGTWGPDLVLRKQAGGDYLLHTLITEP